MAGPAWKGQGRQFVQSTRMSVRLGGAAAETPRPPKLNSRIMVTQAATRQVAGKEPPTGGAGPSQQNR